ncbi:three-helix bundle dimerization domain-containing protein [Actinomadura macra]|uniref:three-helix bundle dimerization domain-containing protein n=1 Tax=Actinomadura macra TaxID=46164 RepID=UPI0008378ABD|nr:hypothetical protein [Actinomadura macra]
MSRPSQTDRERDVDQERKAEQERKALIRLRDRLVITYGAEVSPEEVAALIDEAVAGFAAVSIRDFVPLLVERTVRDELRRRARGDAVAATAERGGR